MYPLEAMGMVAFTGPKGPQKMSSSSSPGTFPWLAAQSGQRHKIRPPLNVAGVDYTVGTASGTIVKNPATDKLPSGCSYNPTGISAPFHDPLVKCQA
jgi:hypothetical protein